MLIESTFVEATPAESAVTLPEAKRALNILQSDTSDDTYVQMLMMAATQMVESLSSRAIITRAFTYYLDGWPRGEIFFPISPVKSVTTVKYYTLDNVLTTMPTSQYDVAIKGVPGYIKPAFGTVLPVVARKPECIEIAFTAGFATAVAGVPEKIKQAVLFLTNHWFMTREPVVVGTAMLTAKVPKTFDYCLSSIRVMGA